MLYCNAAPITLSYVVLRQSTVLFFEEASLISRLFCVGISLKRGKEPSRLAADKIQVHLPTQRNLKLGALLSTPEDTTPLQ